MGIDIKSRAMQGKPVTLVDSPCVGCAECIVRCPMQILHLGELPNASSKVGSLPLVQLNPPALQASGKSVAEEAIVTSMLELPKLAESEPADAAFPSVVHTNYFSQFDAVRYENRE